MNQPDDQERVSRLSTAAPAAPPQGDARGDEIVREYERRYQPEKPKMRSATMPRSYSTMRLTDEEKLWASIAHASAWVTFIGGIVSAGVILPVSVFIPLIIYFMFRKRSDYVAFHALQAFVLQLVGTVGAFALLTVGGLVWLIGMVIAILALVIIVGIVLVPLWGLVGIALAIAVMVLPLAMALYATLAAIETYNGRDYRYPRIAQWVDRQLAGSYLNVV
ncbi:MAG: DUF4870 domain-containing protein [Anaerolinea sp.]|mgnify:CR=1 FL=1|nr:DUF4870 domain-containing protein [Anaerolinea sp.]